MQEFNPDPGRKPETEENKDNNPLEDYINPERKRFGRNVEIIIRIIRHAARPLNQIAPGVELTEAGMKSCVKFGEELVKKDFIGGECSPTVRTEKTANLIVSSSPTENKLPVKEREELSSHGSQDFRERVRTHVKRILGEKYDRLADAEKNKIDLLSTAEGIDYYLAFGDQKPDAQTYSPVETAASVALRLGIAIRKVDRLPSDTTADFFLSTHDYVVAAFLQQVLLQKEDGKEKRGFDSLAELGGDPIAFLENIEITVKTDDEGKKTVSLAFRNKTYGMDMNRLRELIRIGDRLKQFETKNGSGLNREKSDEEIMQEEISQKIGGEF